MRALKIAVLALAVLALTSDSLFARVPQPEEFVATLYQRFAFRDPTPAETTYWSERILNMTPELAEKRLRNWFFVHAVYKTSLDKTVTIHQVQNLVDMLDRGELTYEAVQWSVFTSDEYKKAKAEGRAGKFFMKYTPNAPL
ncbi:MAG: hypothetical protein HY815_23060 [Candidatus Riflebacteria bacterium]|nr:hypothetical protein [Candidatus Riflebacteria bacterium]